MSSNPSAIHPITEDHNNRIMIYSPIDKRHTAKWQKRLAKFIDDGVFQAFLMALLMMSLFLADSWVLGNSPDSSNDALYGLLTVIFVIFMLETICLSLVQDKYFGSFYFFMDLIGNLSIILDIGWMSNSFLPTGAGRSRGSILRATRAAKLGARYGRLMRLLKLMRFVKFLPCFKQITEEEPEPTMSAVRKVSRELISLLSLRIAALTMMLVIVVPFLAYIPADSGPDAFLSTLTYLVKSNADLSLIEHTVNKFHNFYKIHDASLISVELQSPYLPGGSKEYSYSQRKVLRTSNILIYTRSYQLNNVDYTLTAQMDTTFPNQQSSAFGIALMVLVIWILVSFSASFTAAVENLVVAPLNKMMTTLRESAAMMLRSMKAMEELDESKGEKKDGDEDSDLEEELETALLEKMVEKLARIMKHVLPGAQELNIAANVDTATASWLTSNFSQGAGTHVVEAMEVDEDAERIRLMELSASQTVVSNEKLNSWYFDTLDYTPEQLNEILTYVFSIFNFFDEFKIPMPAFKEFLGEIAARYIQNTYHNYKHGVDVCHTVYRLIMVPHLSQAMSTLELFSILIAALAHDVGHPGVNNLYLVKSRNDLALRHNDRSPLENMHCAVLYEIVSKEKSNIFINMTDQQWRDSRKIILTAILGTDMSHHFEQISKTKVFLEVNGEDTQRFCRGEKETIDCFREDNNRLFVLELILHCADISNPYKPFEICYKWCLLVVEEFSLQGDREKAEKLEVSPMCDRNAIVLTNMQMGFIEFVVTPLISAMINVFPPLYEIGQHMCANYMNWGERRKVELLEDEKMSPEAKAEEVKKLGDRMTKYKDSMSYLDAYQVMPRRQSSNPETNTSAAAGNGSTNQISSTQSHHGAAITAPPLVPKPVRRASIKPAVSQ